MNQKIVLTGGGTAGHVIPNIALIEVLQQEGWQIDYVGSLNGVEKNMIEKVGISYYAVNSGKLRRYFSWKNFSDPLKIALGILKASILLRKLRPNVVFSKGGFVAFPVVVGAWLNRIPVVAHESDLSPGLANRLSMPFVNKICVTFAGAKKYFKNPERVEVTGTPIRPLLLKGKKDKGLAFCRFDTDKPCLLIIGGSQGASILNECIRQSLPELEKRFQIIHVCGKGKVTLDLLNKPGYCQLEYVHEELADLFAASRIVISRAGANTLYEILALAKPHVLVPLSAKVSRGDQVENARYFEQQGISTVVPEERLHPDTLIQAINEVMEKEENIIQKIKALAIESAVGKIMVVIKEQANVQY